jgi:protein-S-isoprenylcysteine O-methyltransferase Ste14
MTEPTREQQPATSPPPPASRSLALLSLVWTVAWLAAVQLLLIAVSGRPGWTAAWVLTALCAVVFAVNIMLLLRVNPAVVTARLTVPNRVRSGDRVVTSLMALGYLGSLVVPAMDVRLGWSGAAPWPMAASGIGLFLAGDGIMNWAMAANPFFEPVVRIQQERGHHVISSGPYAFVRHPGYVGGTLFILSQPLILGSRWGLLPAALAVIAMLGRTVLEDRVLRRELPGYVEYAARVRWKLLPGIW